MFSQVSTRLAHEASKSILFSSITGSYVAIGDKLASTARLIMFQNCTNEKLWISFDGVNDGFIIRSGQDIILDVSTNQTYSRGLFLPVGSNFYAKQLGVPTLGSMYVCVFYGED